MQRLVSLKGDNFLTQEAIAKIIRQEEMLRTGGVCNLPPHPEGRLISSSQPQSFCFVIVHHSKRSDSASESYHDVPTQITEEDSSFLTMLASEAVLRREWDLPEEDEAWADL